MTNPDLFVTAAVASFLHLMALLHANDRGHVPGWVAAYMAAGCATSLWNHGGSSDAAKWADRAAMLFGAGATWWHTRHGPLRFALPPAIALYAASKVCKRTEPHLMSHAVVTAVNLHVLSSYGHSEPVAHNQTH